MKRLIHLTIVPALLLLCNAAWAEDVTIDLTSQGYENAEDVTEVTKGDITLTFAKNKSSYSPKYYEIGTAVRIYGKNSFTVSCEDYITGITLTFTSKEYPTTENFSVDSGEATLGPTTTWQGNAKTITFTNTASTGHWRLQKVKVTIADPIEVNGIAALRQLPNGTKVRLTLSPDNAGNIEHVYSGSETSAYVRDNDAALSFVNFLPDDAGWHTNDGGALIGSVLGRYRFINGMPVFTHVNTSIADSILCLDNWHTPTPTVVEDIASLTGTELRADYVVVNGVSLSAADDGNYLMELNGSSIMITNRFEVNAAIPDNLTGREFNVYGILGTTDDGSASQIYYTQIDEIMPVIALNETSPDNSAMIASYDGRLADVSVERKMQTGMWNTICLPFDIDDFSSTVSSAKLAEFTAYDATTNTIEFTSCEKLEAGKPYLVMPEEEVESINLFGTEIKSEIIPITYGSWEMVGVFTPTTLYSGDTNVLFLGENNKLFYPNVTNDLKAFRAYFITTSEEAANICIDGITSNITTATIDSPTGDQRIYNVNGQIVGTNTSTLPKGVYVRSGNKVIIK